VSDCRVGRFQCLAGPGSGKSSVLVYRLAALIQENISPDDLLSLSFTKIAATNLRDRVETLVGPLSINRTAGCLTFHSLALSFSQSERSEFSFELAEFPLAAEPTAIKVAFEAARRYETDPRNLRAAISLFKRRRIRPSQAIRDAELGGKVSEIKTALAYKAYDAKMRSEGVLDFDSLIYEMVEILDKKPAVRERWVRDWIQLDESQDMAKIEWDLVKLISGKSLLAVGDVSQGLYSFRGGDSSLFANMSDMFPGTRTLFLSCNYRSSPEIIDFIRPHAATQDLAAKFHTPNSHGPVPVIRGFQNSAEESAWVVSQIKGGP